MDFPADAKYTKDHEWIRRSKGALARIGITSYAVEQLGDIVHVDLPQVGESYDAGGAFGAVESTKTVSDLYMPVGCKVTKVNAAVAKSPESLQDDAYDEGWLVEVEIHPEADESHLMSAGDYESYVANLEE